MVFDARADVLFFEELLKDLPGWLLDAAVFAFEACRESPLDMRVRELSPPFNAPRLPRPRARSEGARRTGSETASERPGTIVLEERWFHLRMSAADTLKRSATVTSVSPRLVV